MTRTNGEVVGFTFQEIPLEEARNAVLAGDGNYSDVKQMLLEKLPDLAPDKAFAFGLPNGREVPEDKRRGLCMAINATLKRARLNWRVTYSSNRKLFICIPRSTNNDIKNHGNRFSSGKTKSFTPEEKKVFEMRTQGLSANKIASHVDLPIERIRYLVYQVAPGKRKDPDRQLPKTNGSTYVRVTNVRNHLTGELAYTPAKLIETARRIFNYSGDFKNGEAKKIRKAISIVGVKDLGISPKQLAPLVGITADGVSFNAHKSTSALGAMEIKTLKQAVLQG